jgi:hypothetical protein
MNSWSGRLSFQPAANWLFQASGGRLRQPESLHPDDVVRTTASVQYTLPLGNRTGWSTTLMWARNYQTVRNYGTHSVLAETLVPVARDNYISGRFEWSQRDELFANDHDLEHEIFDATGRRSFPVTAFTAGYTRELPAVAALRTAVGFNFTGYAIDDVLKPFYGERPVAATVFVRFRLWDLE